MVDISEKVIALAKKHPKSIWRFDNEFTRMFDGYRGNDGENIAFEKNANGRYRHRSTDDFLEQLKRTGAFEFDINALLPNRCLVYLLNSLPHDDIVKEFGLEMLIWLATIMDDVCPRNVGITGKKHKKVKGDPRKFKSLKRHGIDTNHLTLAISSTKFLSGCLFKDFFSATKRNYEVISSVHKGFCNEVDLSQRMKDNAKDEITLTDNRIGDYKLKPLLICGGFVQNYDGYDVTYGGAQQDGQKRFGIYLDAPVGIGLFYKNEPNAVISFCCEDTDTLLIRQLQGVKGVRFNAEERIIGNVGSRGLVVIDWQKMLVDIVEELAKKLGFKRMGILTGHRNHWTREQNEDGSPHLKLDTAIEMYDNLAKRLNYIQQSLSLEDEMKFVSPKNWYKVL